MHNYNRQQGGTVLGIIVGLIIGLGIALGVAMMITKTPMPFTDKMGRPKQADQNAQVSDPNKPLYGKQAKKPVEEAAKEPAPPNTAVPQPTEKKQEVRVDPKLDAKPAAKVAQESKAPIVEQSAKLGTAEKPKKSENDTRADVKAEAKAEAQDEKWSYYLQAGAFREQNDAENIRAKLALLGVEARISERQADTGVLYRVRVGPFNQMDSMNKVRGKLSDNGVDAAVVRIAK
ncbi:SPOR domain-containing protein [Noviherbaspirillum aerium]|uniref:SPOR domain-containing protein n=1 Tax=Noviherbaspirillum aerium TaxID=2588497 RepID=UPI00124D28C4|nr:SPOR domain-containing protein [Noviherbaspirillum aerium]